MKSPQARAAALAVEAHGLQKYGDRPYVTHLVRVVETLHQFGVVTEDLETAGWLHDVVEDTAVSIRSLRSEFGDRVADLVYAVTTEPGPTRKDRNALTYPKIRDTPGATVLKLCDRIANVESCWETRSPKLFMYHREYPDFRSALRNDADHISLPVWEHLDRLLAHE